jgi:beta-glucosidase
VKLAKNSDVVVLIASLNGEWETEGADRVDMKLPGAQNELIERVAKANKNTIVVLNVGSAVEMPWIEKVPAVLQLWYNSQEQGNALADILFGDENSLGQAAHHLPRSSGGQPCLHQLSRREWQGPLRRRDLRRLSLLRQKGSRSALPVRSRTFLHHVQIQQPAPERQIHHANETLKVKVDVTNTGKVAGREIVQLYVRDVKSTFARPEKELKAFGKWSSSQSRQRPSHSPSTAKPSGISMR